MLMQNFGVTNKEHHDMLFTEGVNCESPCVSLSFPRKYAKFYLILIPFCCQAFVRKQSLEKQTQTQNCTNQ